MKNACEGVMYPLNAKAILQKDFSCEELSKTNCKEFCNLKKLHFASLSLLSGSSLQAITVPHKAWSVCKNELDLVFMTLHAQKLQNQQSLYIKGNVKRIFVLAPLHKGSIIGEPVVIYTPSSTVLKGSDWEIQLELPNEMRELSFIQENDDVCTEEHSLEILSPYLALLYPNVTVSYLLAPQEISKEDIKQLLSKIALYTNESLIFISCNEETHCASMWF